jgi:hypothetical protein
LDAIGGESGAGCGARNNLFLQFHIESVGALQKVRDGEDAVGNTRDACATRKSREHASGYETSL